MLEFRVDCRVGNVAAGGHVEIMQRHRITQAGTLAQHRGHVTAIGLVAKILKAEGFKRQARKHGDAVVALLPVQRDMLISEPLETLERKLVIRAFGFLQA